MNTLPVASQRNLKFFANKRGEVGNNKDNVGSHCACVFAQCEHGLAEPADGCQFDALKIDHVQTFGICVQFLPRGDNEALLLVAPANSFDAAISATKIVLQTFI